MEMEMEKDVKNNQRPEACGKKYNSPKLVDFGRVRQLTTGGTANDTENAMVMGTMP